VFSSPGTIVSFEVPCDRGAPASVRERLRDLTECGNALDDVLVVASELTANAVVHSGGSARDRLAIEARLCGDRVTIAVSDPGLSGISAQPRPRDPGRPGGFGLRIVEQIASDWGAERDRGYRVWAQVPLAV
jgi:anti-sigma regulatory factor (Ser/Thr protein kinase)